jgi:hypothetical protein
LRTLDALQHDQAMTSKHYRWQLAWQVDRAAGLATHDSGLTVQLHPSPHVPGGDAAVRAWLATQTALRDPASQAGRLRRLLREAGELARADTLTTAER